MARRIETARQVFAYDDDDGNILGFVCGECARPGDKRVAGYVGESDTPTHCEDCESLLPIALTDEGYDYVAKAILNYVANNFGRGEVVRAWAREYPLALEGVQEFGATALVELLDAGLDLRSRVEKLKSKV